jgi:hypothetical protein
MIVPPCSLSSFDASQYAMIFGSAEAVAANMGVWMVTRKLTSGSAATCVLHFFMTDLNTKGCLAHSGFLPN